MRQRVSAWVAICGLSVALLGAGIGAARAQDRDDYRRHSSRRHHHHHSRTSRHYRAWSNNQDQRWNYDNNGRRYDRRDQDNNHRYDRRDQDNSRRSDHDRR